MNGMNTATGKAAGGLEHLRQSIRDILTTPIGSRVMRRDYGSRLPDLVDRPLNPLTVVELYAATGEALARWESRFRLTGVEATGTTPEGRIIIAVEGDYLLDGSRIRIEGIVL